jgi:uncharacterized membrane protein
VETERTSRVASAAMRVATAVAIGLVAGVVVGTLASWSVAPVAGWDVAAVSFVVPVWVTIWRLDAEMTSRLATREDPNRAAAHLLLLAASVASLAAAALVLIDAGTRQGAARVVLLILGLVSVVLSWTVVHTIYTLHYARMYYMPPAGGVDFNEEARPRYSDFAYLAFTIGMTFQVSDTDITTKEIRALALGQALLSYLFGAVILATTVNAIAGLSQ